MCWFFTHILMGILICKGLTARRLYKSFGVKGLTDKNIKMEYTIYTTLQEILLYLTHVGLPVTYRGK
jgi:ABC-type microcin C transport system permease subunit YejB